MSFLIRPAEQRDLPQIMNIYNTEILHGTATWNSQPKSLEEYQAWFEELTLGQFPVFVAEDANTAQIAGYADYAPFRQINGYKDTVEHSVYIDPDFTRKGLGKLLLQKLIAHAGKQQLHIMVAAIDSENIGSVLLHEQLGFRQTGYMPEVGQKFGQWRDLILMQLTLD